MSSTEKAAPLKVQKSDDEWRTALTSEQYYVTRTRHRAAVHRSALQRKSSRHIRLRVLRAPLFDTQAKFKSGTGWPSFYAPLNGEAVSEHHAAHSSCAAPKCDARDASASRPRIPDGPRPTGQRYCMNGTALTLPKAG